MHVWRIVYEQRAQCKYGCTLAQDICKGKKKTPGVRLSYCVGETPDHHCTHHAG